MPATVDIGHLIDTDPKIRGGRPLLAGTGVTVNQVAILTEQGCTPSEIAALYPYTSIAHVHAALAYYFAHQAEIDADIAEEDRLFELGVTGQL